MLYDKDYEDGLNHPFFPPCNTCKHFNDFSDPPSCTAFKVIPDSILMGDEAHKKPVRGDNGITWEAE